MPEVVGLFEEQAVPRGEWRATAVLVAAEQVALAARAAVAPRAEEWLPVVV